jgi:hypothetical protein
MCTAPGSSTSRPRGAAAARAAANGRVHSRSRLPRTTVTGTATARSRTATGSGAARRHSAVIARGPVVSHWASTRGTWAHGSAQAVASHRATSPCTERSRGSVVGPSSTTAATRGSVAAAATT